LEAHDSGLSDADKEVAKGRIYKYSSYIETAHIIQIQIFFMLHLSNNQVLSLSSLAFYVVARSMHVSE
jgi:hypothetical protein